MPKFPLLSYLSDDLVEELLRLWLNWKDIARLDCSFINREMRDKYLHMLQAKQIRLNNSTKNIEDNSGQTEFQLTSCDEKFIDKLFWLTPED